MGLAHKLFNEVKGYDSHAMMQAFGITYEVSHEIFIDLPFTFKYRKLQYSEITPEMVADAIDAHLANNHTAGVYAHAV